jgi:uncharacterized protein involved in response to NO
MSLPTIKDQAVAVQQKLPLLKVGFRLFFLGAAIFAVVSVWLWIAIYAFGMPIFIQNMSSVQWHAHEMIFGYSLAVIAGFLLTAVGNWTGRTVLNGWRLAGLFALWATARVLLLFGSELMPAAALADIAFSLSLLIVLAIPIVRTRQWKQLGLLTKVLLLGIANACFYLGYFGQLDTGIHLGIYGGLFLVIGVVLTMGRRVVPLFIERGLDYPVQLRNNRWLDGSSLVLFLAFFVVVLFYPAKGLSALFAGALFVVTSLRLAGWYTAGIWRLPLLWSLYLAFVFIDIGFLLFALSAITSVSKFLAIHAFATGGIGIVTLSMMARVSLGHTGRQVSKPPALVVYMLVILSLAAVIRVILPLFSAGYYLELIVISQGLWIVAFSLFIVAYFRILTTPDNPC